MAPGAGRDFNCSWEHCGKSFNRKSDLCRHYRIHTNERPYHCTVQDCNKSFIQRSALTVHSRTHTGEKPHVCDHEGCEKAFSDSSSLARHRRIHTGRRPYICQEPTCERSFCRKTTLTKHQHRSHRTGATRPSSEEVTPERTYSASTAVPPGYVLHQTFYPQPQAVPQAPVQELPIVTQTVSPHPPQYLVQINRSNFVPPEFHQAPPFTAPQLASDGHPILVSYPELQFKSGPRVLNQSEGTDWTFLGVG